MSCVYIKARKTCQTYVYSNINEQAILLLCFPPFSSVFFYQSLLLFTFACLFIRLTALPADFYFSQIAVCENAQVEQNRHLQNIRLSNQTRSRPRDMAMDEVRHLTHDSIFDSIESARCKIECYQVPKGITR